MSKGVSWVLTKFVVVISEISSKGWNEQAWSLRERVRFGTFKAFENYNAGGINSLIA